MMMQGEEEHHSMQDQKDQVCYQTLSCGDMSLNFKYYIKCPNGLSVSRKVNVPFDDLC